MKCGIDVGFGFTKAASEKVKGGFPSAVAKLS